MERQKEKKELIGNIRATLGQVWYDRGRRTRRDEVEQFRGAIWLTHFGERGRWCAKGLKSRNAIG